MSLLIFTQLLKLIANRHINIWYLWFDLAQFGFCICFLFLLSFIQREKKALCIDTHIYESIKKNSIYNTLKIYCDIGRWKEEEEDEEKNETVCRISLFICVCE